MRKIVWTAAACSIVATLLLASCAPAPATPTAPSRPAEPARPATPAAPAEKPAAPAAPAEAKPGMVKWAGKKADGTAVEKWLEKPKYGGQLNLALSSRILQMDQASGRSHQGMYYNDMTFDPLTKVDWTRGPAGTGESSMFPLTMLVPKLMKGALAESWELPDAETIIVRLRKGVRFHNKPPVNGRELVASDVVFTENRLYFDMPKSYLNIAFTPDRKPQSVKALDRYTVEFKVVPAMVAEVMRGGFDFTRIEPREVIDRYGNMEDWTRLIGTGPFLIVDHVEGSVTTFKRNPDYWEKDPFFPENQLPYVDGVKFFLIEDASTRQAALRTGQLDMLAGLTWEDSKTMLRYTADLQVASGLPVAPHICMRVDTKPFDDVRVRRALSLAVDKETMLKSLYGGDGSLISMPVPPIADYSDFFVPLEELPESAREMFSYNPEKARKLLAEAGYPGGFKTEVLATAAQVDVASVVKEYLAKIGVEVKIDVRETAVYSNLALGKKYPQMIYAGGVIQNPPRFHSYRTGAPGNYAMLDDPNVMKIYNDVPMPVTEAGWKEVAPKMKEIVPYIIDQAWSIPLPLYNTKTMWWPWLKGYHGELSASFHHYLWPTYVWIDQDLKEAKIGKR